MGEHCRHEKMASGADRGRVDGLHFTAYVDRVKALRRAGQEQVAEALLLRLLEATEAESRSTGEGVAPWFYEQLVAIYRKRQDGVAERRILERFAAQQQPAGASTTVLLQRLRDIS